MTVAATVTAVTFNCLYTEAVWLGIGFHYQCQTMLLSVESTQYLTNVTGTHLQNKTNDDVAAIHVGHCSDLSYIPKGMLNFFPNLRAIYFQGCGIATLNGTELYEYPKLILFALEMSPLDHVPGKFFAENPDMFFVSFNDNQIKTVGPDLLDNMNKLTDLFFDNNTCINANASTIQEMTVLKETLIQNCSLRIDILNLDITDNATSGEVINELKENQQNGSLASSLLNSVSLQTLLLSVLLCFGIWLN